MYGFIKNPQHDFLKMRGGCQRPLGTFPFWTGDAFLIVSECAPVSPCTNNIYNSTSDVPPGALHFKMHHYSGISITHILSFQFSTLGRLSAFGRMCFFRNPFLGLVGLVTLYELSHPRQREDQGAFDN